MQNACKCMQFHQIAKNDPFSNYWLSITFWDINLIFDSGKSWNCIFWDGKVFYPIKNFFTLLLTSWKSEKLKNLKIRFVASSAQKGGKKLSEGVKNFFMIKSNVSAFSWTKNHTFIWQTHSYSSDQTTAAKSHLGGAIWGISFKHTPDWTHDEVSNVLFGLQSSHPRSFSTIAWVENRKRAIFDCQKNMWNWDV